MNGIQENQKLGSAQNANQLIGTKKKLTQKRLKEVLIYDPRSGYFIAKIMRRGMRGKIGDSIGYRRSDSYITISIDGSSYLASRLAFLYMEGYFPENDADHIDKDPSNTKWDNLRDVSRSCNMKNGNIKTSNKSGVTGVSWNKKADKWEGHIGTPSGKKYLGIFKNKESAAIARFKAEKQYGYDKCNNYSPAYSYLLEEGLI